MLSFIISPFLLQTSLFDWNSWVKQEKLISQCTYSKCHWRESCSLLWSGFYCFYYVFFSKNCWKTAKSSFSVLFKKNLFIMENFKNIYKTKENVINNPASTKLMTILVSFVFSLSILRLFWSTSMTSYHFTGTYFSMRPKKIRTESKKC